MVFCLGMALTLYGIAYVVLDFLAYPVITTTDLNHRLSVPFPAITVCNQNRWVFVTYNRLQLRKLCKHAFRNKLFFSSRVNCVNLIMEYSKQSEYNASLDESHPNKTTTATNAHYLAIMLDVTGCRQQICDNIDELIPDERKDGASDGLVTLAPVVG